MKLNKLDKLTIGQHEGDIERILEELKEVKKEYQKLKDRLHTVENKVGIDHIEEIPSEHGEQCHCSCHSDLWGSEGWMRWDQTPLHKRVIACKHCIILESMEVGIEHREEV